MDSGTLQVVDNQVDQTTGTVRMKADFPNAELQLWPGQFVNVRVLIQTLSQVVVMPTPAVQRGPNGPFAYVIQADDRVELRPITVQQQTDTQAVVASGIGPGERVVTTGFARLKDGGRVAVSNSDGQAPETDGLSATARPVTGAAPEAGPQVERKKGEGRRKREDGEQGAGSRRARKADQGSTQ